MQLTRLQSIRCQRIPMDRLLPPAGDQAMTSQPGRWRN